jgi:hypothetical protein
MTLLLAGNWRHEWAMTETCYRLAQKISADDSIVRKCEQIICVDPSSDYRRATPGGARLMPDHYGFVSPSPAFEQEFSTI